MLKYIAFGCYAVGALLLGPPLFTLIENTYIYDYKGSSVVYLRGKGSGGTGFVVKDDNGKKYTLTNKHICALKSKDGTLEYETTKGEKGKAKVIEEFREHDLCVLEPVPGLIALSMASNAKVQEPVWLVGHPALRPLTLENGYLVDYLDIDVASTCSAEQLRVFKEQIDKDNAKFQKDCGQISPECLSKFFDLMQRRGMLARGYCILNYNAGHINAISYGGNSGSPVLNMWGNVIGVLFAGDSRQNTASYIVPLVFVRKFLNKER